MTAADTDTRPNTLHEGDCLCSSWWVAPLITAAAADGACMRCARTWALLVEGSCVDKCPPMWLSSVNRLAYVQTLPPTCAMCGQAEDQCIACVRSVSTPTTQQCLVLRCPEDESRR